METKMVLASSRREVHCALVELSNSSWEMEGNLLFLKKWKVRVWELGRVLGVSFMGWPWAYEKARPKTHKLKEMGLTKGTFYLIIYLIIHLFFFLWFRSVIYQNISKTYIWSFLLLFNIFICSLFLSCIYYFL